VVFLLNTTVGLATYSDARALAGSIGGATAAIASAFVVVVSLSDAAGRLVWPVLSDGIGGANVFLAMFLVQAAAFSLMPVLGAGSFAAFCVLASAVTSCYGGGYATMSALSAAYYYGPQDIGAIYGGILTASAPAGFGAPLLLARSADLTGSYELALYAAGALMLAGAAIPLARSGRPASREDWDNLRCSGTRTPRQDARAPRLRPHRGPIPVDSRGAHPGDPKPDAEGCNFPTESVHRTVPRNALYSAQIG
jgi:nitrate/nitrite transporter NarK